MLFKVSICGRVGGWMNELTESWQVPNYLGYPQVSSRKIARTQCAFATHVPVRYLGYINRPAFQKEIFQVRSGPAPSGPLWPQVMCPQFRQHTLSAFHHLTQVRALTFASFCLTRQQRESTKSISPRDDLLCVHHPRSRATYLEASWPISA